MKKYVVLLTATACMVMGVNAAERYGYNGTDKYNGTDNSYSTHQTHTVTPNVNNEISKKLNAQLSEMQKNAADVEKTLKEIRAAHLGGGEPLTNFGLKAGFPIGDVGEDIESLRNMLSKLQNTITQYSEK